MSKYVFEVIIALVAATPGIAALFTRRRAIIEKSQAVAKRTTLDEFNALYGEQRRQLVDCRDECSACRRELRDAEEKIDVLENKVYTLERELREEERQRAYFEEAYRRGRA